ncbi:MAG: peptidoglycan-binding domain-containing protein [Bryobacteraceae bacterium]
MSLLVAPAQQKSTAKKSTAAPKGGVAPKTSSAKRAPAKGTQAKKAPAKKAAPARVTQQTPTPERYREIQQALAEKGYLQATPTGQWGPESIEALKRFQQDQNIPATGKLNALSLIALGLGPKRDSTVGAASLSRPEQAPEQQPEETQ